MEELYRTIKLESDTKVHGCEILLLGKYLNFERSCSGETVSLHHSFNPSLVHFLLDI